MPKYILFIPFYTRAREKPSRCPGVPVSQGGTCGTLGTAWDSVGQRGTWLCMRGVVIVALLCELRLIYVELLTC